MLGIKIIDLDWGNVNVLSGPCARWWDGVLANWLLREVDLGRGRAAETLMGPEKNVGMESECESLLELVENERLESLERKALFQGSPQSFDKCDGAGSSDGAEAVSDAELGEPIAKIFGGELASLVGDEVARHAEALDGGLEKPEDGWRGRFL